MSTTWITLFRGINVGGNNLLPMSSLVSLLGAIGATDVRTYIQSGNAVFRSVETNAVALTEAIAKAIAARHGFRPRVLALTIDQLERAAKANPFPKAEAEPKSLHLYFLATRPGGPDLEAITDAKSSSERYALKDDVFYLHTPNGIGRSRLAGRVERLLGVTVTARNWRSVLMLLALARQCDQGAGPT